MQIVKAVTMLKVKRLTKLLKMIEARHYELQELLSKSHVNSVLKPGKHGITQEMIDRKPMELTVRGRRKARQLHRLTKILEQRQAELLTMLNKSWIEEPSVWNEETKQMERRSTK
ncbi:hypothetical protein [Bowmanella yangjiangensis]|uniref:Uncharacterized protein n=1 Tax=Bowmanella yangjiangensis TaxID=2811230 RepID=A0ABS3CTS2_9ALTE|nr:hypothetical protein [Bowmanella yangjiangensis]MBN7820518.1 hypothetical protein [Bowmanella yangjiangensis]